ncbi:PAS domain-containing protein, partial [bacterium]|nr:PAS domain-containing protein [bacterium]
MITKKALLVDGEDVGSCSLTQLIKQENFKCSCVVVRSVLEARQRLAGESFDIVVADYLMPDGTVFDLLTFLLDTPLIVVSNLVDIDVAVKVMKAGVYDYIIKDNDANFLRFLPVTIEKAIYRKESEDRLRLLESAVSHANDAIVILEAEPAELRGRKILYVNDAFCRMSGYSYEEATSRTLRMLRGPKTNRLELTKINEALKKCLAVRVELINYRKDGSEFWVECNIVPFAGEDGKFIHWVSIQRDI